MKRKWKMDNPPMESNFCELYLDKSSTPIRVYYSANAEEWREVGISTYFGKPISKKLFTKDTRWSYVDWSNV